MPDVTLPVDQGFVGARDAMDLLQGEMRQLTGVYYKSKDPNRVHVWGGRTSFGDVGSGEIKNVHLCRFDSGGVDRLVFLVGTTIYSATPGLTGTPASLVTGLDADTSGLSVAHSNDKFFLCTGLDTNRVLKADGTIVNHGLEAPTEAPTAVAAAAAGVVIRPAAPSGVTSGAALMVDGNNETFGTVRLSSAGSTTIRFSGSGWAGSAAARQFIMKWALSSSSLFDIPDSAPPTGRQWGEVGGDVDAGFQVNVVVAISENAGALFTEIQSSVHNSFVGITNLQFPIVSDPDNFVVDVTLNYIRGRRPATLRIYDTRLQTGSAASNFTTTSGIKYAYQEWDETEGIGGPLSPSTVNVTLTAQNQVTLTMQAQVNTRATHRRIFKTLDGGTIPDQFGLIAQIPIGQTVFVDDFIIYPHTVQPRPLYPLLVINLEGGELRIDRDSPPPAFRKIRTFKGSLLGFREDKRRALHYNVPGLDESWPELYFFGAFPDEEHDELVDGFEIGESFVLLAREVVKRIDTLPRTVRGQFDASAVITMKGAPGLAADNGATPCSVKGESRLAWIAEDGIYHTNGFQFERLDELDFTEFEGFDKSSWVLKWIKDLKILIFSYSSLSDGTNDRWVILHLDQLKSNELPKMTGPHYGAIASITSGMVGSDLRIFTGHTSDGRIYVERNGEVDASNSYDSNQTAPVILGWPRIYGPWYDTSVLKASLRHDDFGSGEVGSLSWKVGFDEPPREHSKTQNISLSTRRGTEVDVSRSGEWHEPTLTYLGGKFGWFLDLRMESDTQARSGKISSGSR